MEVYLKTIEEVLSNLKVRRDVGLSAAEVKKRAKRDGANTIPRGDRFHLLKLFTERFRDTLVIILLLAGADCVKK